MVSSSSGRTRGLEISRVRGTSSKVSRVRIAKAIGRTEMGMVSTEARIRVTSTNSSLSSRGSISSQRFRLKGKLMPYFQISLDKDSGS